MYKHKHYYYKEYNDEINKSLLQNVSPSTYINLYHKKYQL